VKKLASTRTDEIAERSREMEEGVFSAISDPHNPTVAPKKLTPPPSNLDFAPLMSAVTTLKGAAARYDSAYARAVASGRTSVAKTVNGQLLQAERALTTPEGLSKRPWYQHLIYAPGFYTGYGVKTLPGIREAIEQGEWSSVGPEIARVSAALTREAALLDSLTSTLSSGR
jgi:N-acetylated-alpha-linked acidic dipeptidase